MCVLQWGKVVYRDRTIEIRLHDVPCCKTGIIHVGGIPSPSSTSSAKRVALERESGKTLRCQLFLHVNIKFKLGIILTFVQMNCESIFAHFVYLLWMRVS